MIEVKMEQAGSCENCGVENDLEDFVHYVGDWICPDCHTKALDERFEEIKTQLETVLAPFKELMTANH